MRLLKRPDGDRLTAHCGGRARRAPLNASLRCLLSRDVMVEFTSWRSYWKFARTVRTRTRYVYDSGVKTFLDTVLATGHKRVEVIPAAAHFWRAQLGNDWIPIYQGGECVADEPAPHVRERMKPQKDRSREGRANPKGITYLYLATNRDTALAEVRPWVGSLVSVGQFKMLREVRLVNCTTDGKGHRVYVGREPSPSEREESVWTDIDRAFAEPLNPSDDFADYVPTQIIAELFKANAFDGVAYRSSLGPGHNVTLFDPDAAELINCFLFEVKGLKFEFRQAANPYTLRKHNDTKELKHGGA